jgi:hypothetical protein
MSVKMLNGIRLVTSCIGASGSTVTVGAAGVGQVASAVASSVDHRAWL